MPRTRQYARQIANFYGRQGDDNGVVVSNADLPDDILGDTARSRDGAVTIRFDLAAITSQEANGPFGALTGQSVAAHEGAHGLEYRLFSSPRTFQQRYLSELRAYQAELDIVLGEGFDMSPTEQRFWLARSARASTVAVCSPVGGCPNDQ